jgi:hypothetical protein
MYKYSCRAGGVFVCGPIGFLLGSPLLVRWSRQEAKAGLMYCGIGRRC